MLANNSNDISFLNTDRVPLTEVAEDDQEQFPTGHYHIENLIDGKTPSPVKQSGRLQQTS